VNPTAPAQNTNQSAAAAPPKARPAKPKLGPAYWAGLAFGAVCILLGLVLGLMGSRIAPSDRIAAAPPPPAPVVAPRPASAPAPRPVATAPAAPAPAAAPPVSDETATSAAGEPFVDPQVAILQARLAEVEARQQGTARAAAAALALGSLTQAAEGSRPFAPLVDAARAAVPASPDLKALRQLAAVGAPSRAGLAQAYPAFAARAAVAARQPGPRAGVAAKLGYYLAGMITVRRTDELSGPGADAILARAGRAAEAGDLRGALAELATLSAPARGAMGPWRADAERRLAMEARLATLRAATEQSLRSPPA
jgi:hypothetical protein